MYDPELIKYIDFWKCGSRVKSGSIVITSLHNISLKSVYFLHSVYKWISFSTKLTVHCSQSLSVGGGTGRR